MGSQRPSDTEQVLLLATWRLGDKAYGLTIRNELSARAGRRMAIGAVYSTLIRLERKGWVRSHLTGATPVRGGKAKRYFRITPEGMQVLQEARAAMDQLWEGLESVEPRSEEA